MSDLAPGWEWTTLEGLAAAEPRAMTDGPFGSNLKTSHYVDSGPRVIRLQNIGFGEFIDEEAHISEEHFETLRSHEAKAGDLVVASLGQDLPRACLVPPTLGPAIVKADCIRVRLHPDVHGRYVNYALQRPHLRHAVANQIHGVGRPRLGMAGVRQLSIPMAPRTEQERIVAAIEERLSRLDTGISTLSNVPHRVQQLAWAPAEAAWRSLPTNLRPLSEIAEIVTGTTPSTKKPDYWDGDHSFTTPVDLEFGGQVLATRRQLSDAGFEVARWLPEGAVLVTCIGATLGKTAVTVTPMAFNQQINGLLPSEDAATPRYLLAALSCPTGQRRLWEASSSTTLPILNKSRLSKLGVPIPPLEVQRQIEAKVAQAQDLGIHLMQEVERASTRALALRRSILAAAFSGRLVPQDPADEPASVLLDRIRAERATATSTKRTRRAEAS